MGIQRFSFCFDGNGGTLPQHGAENPLLLPICVIDDSFGNMAVPLTFAGEEVSLIITENVE